MFSFYLICAAIGCTVMVVQLIMTLMGLGGDGDGMDAPHFDAHFDSGDMHLDAHISDVGSHGDVHLDSDTRVAWEHADVDTPTNAGASWFFGVLSFRALVAAVAFFGLTGLATLEGGFHPYLSLVLAAGAAATAMLIVAWLMRLLGSLSSEGTVSIHNALGAPATVYLPIPGASSGVGKVTIRIQDRTMEYEAMTKEEALKTGTPVVVTGIIGSEVLEVAPINRGENK